jgi:CubicO group peptidase (beta-lactamase class C family)
LIEVWSGEPLDRFVQSDVLDRLEMFDTGFMVPAGKRARFASCQLLREGKLTVLDPAATSLFTGGFEFLSAGGGLVCTVNDYANFCEMLVGGGRFKGRRVLKEVTLQLMFSDQLRGVGGESKFGLGFGIDEVEFGSGESRRKALRYRWGGYAGTEFEVVPEERFFQIFALQQVPYSDDLAKQEFALIRKGLSAAAKAAGVTASDAK